MTSLSSSPILDNVVRSITPQIISAVSSRLHESEAGVQHGLTSAVASVLGGIASHENDSSFGNQIMSLASNPMNSSGTNALSALTLGTPNSALMAEGHSLLSLLFGSHMNDAAAGLAQSSGVSVASASTMFGLAAPLVLGWINQQIHDQHMTAATLASFLKGEAPALRAAAPPAVRSLLGAEVVPMPVASLRGILPLWPILGVVFLAGFMWWLTHWSPTAAPVPEAPKIVTSVNPEMQAAMSKLGSFVTRKLPTGVELNIPQFGIENKLVQFIEDPNKPADKTTWFDFDRLLFDTGKATLQPYSQEQLENIANILKAFPNVKVKLGGYTDNVGGKAFNMKLSSDRANNVMNELIGMGISKDRLQAEGYGEEHPVADNATEEGRAQNRRISLRVTEK